MHEVSLARNIVEIVREHLSPESACEVQSVTVRIGELAGVIPESLEFCFRALTQGTALEHTSLIIRREPIKARCENCGRKSLITIDSFKCPVCGSNYLTLLAGTELRVSEIETVDIPVPST